MWVSGAPLFVFSHVKIKLNPINVGSVFADAQGSSVSFPKHAGIGSSPLSPAMEDVSV